MSHHTRISEKKRNRKKLVVGIVTLLAIVLLFGGGLLAIHIWENSQVDDIPDVQVEKETIEYYGKVYEKKNNVETLLVMGLDKYEAEISEDSYNNDQRADFLMLFVIDNENETCTAVHINRDTMAQMNVLGLKDDVVSTTIGQLALAHTYGSGGAVSCRNTVNAVSGVLLDTKIDHYVSVTMDAVPAYNDLVGGVEVEVLDDFTGIDDTLIKGETVTLLGEHSINYVRTRYGLEDSTNSTRMERQRQYINALVEKTQSCVELDSEFITSALEITTEYLVSDCTIARMESLFEKISAYEFKEIYELEGDLVVGEPYMEFYPYEDSIKEVLINVLYTPIQ